MFQDPAFVNLVKERYTFFRNNEQHLYDMIDENVSYIQFAQKNNDELWKTIGMWVWPNPKVYSTYDLEVSYLKSWIQQRFQWLDYGVSQL